MGEEPSALDRLQPRPHPTSRQRRGVIGAVVAAILFFLTKAKILLAAVKLGPLLFTIQTMALSATLYAGTYGWALAVGLILLILVHEIGHGVAAKRVGVPVGYPVFVPFFGAFIALKGKPRSTVDESIIAAGGPIFGSTGAALCLAASLVDSEHAGFLRVVGYYALILNLFNLTPVWTLDGARMLAPVGTRLAAAGAAVAVFTLVASAMWGGHLNPVALIAVGAGAVRTGIAWWRARRAPAEPRTVVERIEAAQREARAVPDDVPAAHRARAAEVYFTTLCLLAVAVHGLARVLPAH